MDTRQIAFLRPDQILAEMQRCPLAYLPVGPLEWHGPHLPIGTDPFNAEKVAQLAAEKTGGLVLPTFYWGTERERSPQLLDWLGFEQNEWIVGMDFPANSLPSMYASEEIFALAMREQLRLAIHLGFKLVAVISGHGAENQLEVLERLANEFNAESPAHVLVMLPFIKNQEGVMQVGHASKIETSVMLALHPEQVKLEALPGGPEPLRNTDWAIVDYLTFSGTPAPDHTVSEQDDPRRATADEGWENIRLATAEIVSRVEIALNKYVSSS